MRKLFHICIVGMALLLSPVLFASCNQDYLPTGQWNKDCGPSPSQVLSTDIAKSCAAEILKTANSPGAVWHLKNSWMSQDQCDQLKVKSTHTTPAELKESMEQWKQDAIRDCEATVKKIAARPGASWNSEYNWMFEDQCEKLRIEEKKNVRHHNKNTSANRLYGRSSVHASLVVGSTAPS